jgi:23S rRNA (pseudouridine1915-N3)-methyltransferase
MKITLLAIGKTNSAEIRNIVDDYSKRITRYVKFEAVYIENSQQKFSDNEKQKIKEGEHILKKLQAGDYLILLDERGKEYNSVQFAEQLNLFFNQSIKNICFVIGGAYGFSEDVYARSNAKISLSRMTFSHQIIRIIFAEQLYRAFTIINNEPYHHS